MKMMSPTSFRQNLYETIKKVEGGLQISIVRNGEEVARLVPPENTKNISKKPVVPADFYVKFCTAHAIDKLFLFGSILTDDFDDESDVDIMYETKTPFGFHELMSMTRELEKTFGRKVDFVDKRSVEANGSPTRRKEILENAKVVYVA